MEVTKCSKAWSFILVLIMVVTHLETSEACHPHDKQVLLQIKQHFNNVYPFSTWDPNTNCCNWTKLGCDSSDRITHFMVELEPSESAVSGEIPPIIGDLPFLQILAFVQIPKLTGSIPHSLVKLTKLWQLSLNLDNLSGPIPNFLSEMKSLISLDLEGNQFSGTIPSSLSLLPKLSSLSLSRNKLSGSIPESFGSFKNEIQLFLDTNQLSGVIPKSLGNVNFSYLTLSYNNFSGDASFLFGRDKPLWVMTFRNNSLSFNFTNVELPSTIFVFDISCNMVYGSIPRQFDQLSMVDHFDVSDNQLCGKVPKGRLQQFEADRFANNKCLCNGPGLPPCH